MSPDDLARLHDSDGAREVAGSAGVHEVHSLQAESGEFVDWNTLPNRMRSCVPTALWHLRLGQRRGAPKKTRD